MNALLAAARDDDHPAAREPHVWSGPRTTSTTQSDPWTELLRAIASVLDIRSVFPRISTITEELLPHDGLALVLMGQSGHPTLEASAPVGLPAHRWTGGEDENDSSIFDLRRLRFRWADGASSGFDDLIQAGYRSALCVRTKAQSEQMQLTFFSKERDTFTAQQVPVAQRIADYVAVAVAHEQLASAERARAEARTRSETLDARLRATIDKRDCRSGAREMIGRSDAWRDVLARALRVASTDTTVFLHGESGTGKELVARFIHQSSPRRDGPFVAINCAALPEQLLESELFGYERGAFTGAHQAKAGQIDLAAKGVLLLDEVSEMSLTAQAKFLRVLQEREFQRLGGTRVQKANIRVIAATNHDLGEAVQCGTFREDLLYRLHVFDVHLPPLRERLTDIPPLADYFLAEVADAMGAAPARLTDEARDLLLAYQWPGNIRELRNVLESAAILSDNGVIRSSHLSLHAPAAPAAPAMPRDLVSIERQMIESTLRRTSGNKSKAARVLGLTRTQLYVRLRRHGLDDLIWD